MSFNGLYDIRAVQPEDMNFVMATFLRGLYYGDPWYQQVPKDIFMNAYKRAARYAWESPGIKIRVACLKEDPNIILGYSVVSADDQAIIWVFVKTPWRKQGIAKSLLPQSPKFATHLTTLGKSLMGKFPGLEFNPFFPEGQ